MIELNTIYNENCIDTMLKMPDNYIDLTVTSPPYDNIRDYNGYTFDFPTIAKDLFRITKKGGVVVWIVGDATIKGSETLTSFKQALFFKEIGFSVYDTMIYQKTGCVSPQRPLIRYSPSFEYMFILCKGERPKTLNIKTFPKVGKVMTKSKRQKDGSLKRGTYLTGGGALPNVWKYNSGINVASEKVAFSHPAIFPEKLAYDHIKSWSNENDIIYDPFSGSGTVAKACICLNRNYIGSEISKEYMNIIHQRLQPYKKNLFTVND